MQFRLRRYKSLPNTGTTATVEDDYTRTTGRLFFPRFVSSIVFQVPIIQDAILEDPDEHVEIILFDARYEDTAFVAPRGQPLPGLANASAPDDPSSGLLYTSVDLSEELSRGDEIRVMGRSYFVRTASDSCGPALRPCVNLTQPFNVVPLEAAAPKQTANLTLIKVAPSLGDASMKLRIMGDARTARHERLPGTFTIPTGEAGRVQLAGGVPTDAPGLAALGQMVAPGTRILLFKDGAGDPIRGGDAPGQFTVTSLDLHHARVYVTPTPTEAFANTASTGEWYRVGTADAVGVIDFTMSEYIVPEQHRSAASGGHANGDGRTGIGGYHDVVVGLTRTGGSSGRVAVSIATCDDPLSADNTNCAEALRDIKDCNDFPAHCAAPPRARGTAQSGRSAPLPGHVVATRGSPFLLASEDVTALIDRGDLIHLSDVVVAVHEYAPFNKTHIPLARRSNSSGPMWPYDGLRVGPMRVTAVTSRIGATGVAGTDATSNRALADVQAASNTVGITFDPRGDIARGSSVKIGDGIYTVSMDPIEDHGPVGVLHAGPTHGFPASAESRLGEVSTGGDLRHGFVQFLVCVADRGYFHVNFGSYRTLAIPWNASAALLELELERLGNIVDADVEIAASRSDFFINSDRHPIDRLCVPEAPRNAGAQAAATVTIRMRHVAMGPIVVCPDDSWVGCATDPRHSIPTMTTSTVDLILGDPDGDGNSRHGSVVVTLPPVTLSRGSFVKLDEQDFTSNMVDGVYDGSFVPVEQSSWDIAALPTFTASTPAMLPPRGGAIGMPVVPRGTAFKTARLYLQPPLPPRTLRNQRVHRFAPATALAGDVGATNGVANLRTSTDLRRGHVQHLTCRATGGSFQLLLDGTTTAPIPAITPPISHRHRSTRSPRSSRSLQSHTIGRTKTTKQTKNEPTSPCINSR